MGGRKVKQAFSSFIRVSKRKFWDLPISPELKEKARTWYVGWKDSQEEEISSASDIQISADAIQLQEYAKQVLATPSVQSEFYSKLTTQPIQYQKEDPTLIAYYLTQFHPTKQNDEWWGKGTTEWNNVSKAVPQFFGHNQPRLPGELGYYDLRLAENMMRQAELAQIYGIRAFCFYYYWFDGDRLLEKPLEMFLKEKNIDISFCLCWANESWTKRFSGVNEGILMKIGETEESYLHFIDSTFEYMKDPRYLCVNGCPVLSVYRPSLIPNVQSVLDKWQQTALKVLGKRLYIIAVQEKDNSFDWCSVGFDAETEFQPKRALLHTRDITGEINPIRKDYSGRVFDYKDLVENKRYAQEIHDNKKLYRAVMPMWDNTARRDNRGIVFHQSTPVLYQKWLEDILCKTRECRLLDAPLVFINAWNEWGEGTYLEPDRYYGYAYLQATKNAIEKDRLMRF